LTNLFPTNTFTPLNCNLLLQLKGRKNRYSAALRRAGGHLKGDAEMEERKVYAVYWLEDEKEEITDSSSPEESAMLTFTDKATAEEKKKLAEEDIYGAKVEGSYVGNGRAIVREMTLKFNQ